MEKSIAAVKQGAVIEQNKAGELTKKRKRQYTVLKLKARIHEAFIDLGAKTYVLMSCANAKNPAIDVWVKEIMARIQDLEAQAGYSKARDVKVVLKRTPKHARKHLKRNETE